MKHWREIAVALCIMACAAAGGAAVDVRDRVARCESTDQRIDEVQAERYKAIVQRLDDIRADILALKK